MTPATRSEAQAAVLDALRQGPGTVAEILDRCHTRILRGALREAVGQLVHTREITLDDDLATIRPTTWT